MYEIHYTLRKKKNFNKNQKCVEESGAYCVIGSSLRDFQWWPGNSERERERDWESVCILGDRRSFFFFRERERERSVAVVRYKRSVRVRVRLSGTEIQFKLTNSKWEISFVISAILFAASTLFVSSYFYLSLSLPFFVFNF